MESQVNQMVSGGNEKLIIESLKWMTDTEDSATVSIPSKSLSVSYLTLTDYDAAFMRMMIKDILTKNGYNIAGEAENGQKAVEKYAELNPIGHKMT